MTLSPDNEHLKYSIVERKRVMTFPFHFSSCFHSLLRFIFFILALLLFEQ